MPKTGVLTLEDVNGLAGRHYMKFSAAFGGRDTVYVACGQELGEVQPTVGYSAWDVFMEANEVDEFYKFACVNGTWKVVDVDDTEIAKAKSVRLFTFQGMFDEIERKESDTVNLYTMLSEKTWLPFDIFNRGWDHQLFIESKYGQQMEVTEENIHLFVTRPNTDRYRFVSHRGLWKVVAIAERTMFRKANLKLMTIQEMEAKRFSTPTDHAIQQMVI